jgi:hypothetical protein
LAEVVVVEEAAQVGQRLVDVEQGPDLACLASASASVAATTGPMPAGKPARPRPPRPGLGAGAHLLAKARVSSSEGAWVNTASAYCRPARCRPPRTGLEDHRLALRRAPDVERAGHLEEAALVIECAAWPGRRTGRWRGRA